MNDGYLISSNVPEGELLEQIEQCGSVLFDLEETALAVGLPLDYLERLMRDTSSPEYRAYHRGRLQTMLDVRRSIVSMARNGSGPAQSLVKKLIEDYEFKAKTKGR